MNFCFFFPDEMRAESVSCLGHPIVSMPNYDRVAAEGVRFEQCHVQHTVCSPSRCSLMTGWYPHVAGHRTLWNLLRRDEPSMFGYLREAGYNIQWRGKNDLYAPDAMGLNVNHWEHARGGHCGPSLYTPEQATYWTFLSEPFPGTLEDTADMRDVRSGIRFLREHRPGDPPFFLYLPLSMPHPPYGAPEPFHSMYATETLPPMRPAGLTDKPDFHSLIRQYRHLDRVGDDIFRQVQAIYLGMNSYVDWMLGELLQCLDETGLAENTTLIIASDHGDWAGDYGLVEKWPSAMDDTLTRVPLLFRVPGTTAGHAVAEPIELFDIMPTVLELAGIKARHTHMARSLVPQLHGAAGDPERAVFCEGGYDPHEPHCFEGRSDSDALFREATNLYYPKGLQQQEHPESVCRTTMLRTNAFKLVRRTAGDNELYDLQRDPLELQNRYADPALAGTRHALESRMLDWCIHTADVVRHEHPRGVPDA
ncbi:MAG: sulfatase-like hydrolase/transferase [Anaerolineae bacterium]